MTAASARPESGLADVEAITKSQSAPRAESQGRPVRAGSQRLDGRGYQWISIAFDALNVAAEQKVAFGSR